MWFPALPVVWPRGVQELLLELTCRRASNTSAFGFGFDELHQFRVLITVSAFNVKPKKACNRVIGRFNTLLSTNPLHNPFRRVMLKVSGEALEGSRGFGIDPVILNALASEVAAAASEGVQIAVVVGGGNFFRGVDRWDGLERATADYVGMLATVMNAICLQSALEALGVQTRVQTAIAMQVCTLTERGETLPRGRGTSLANLFNLRRDIK